MDLEIAFFIGIDEISIQKLIFMQKINRFINTKYHQCCGISISCYTIICYYGCA